MTMKTRKMSKDGPEVTVIGLGTMSWPGCRYGHAEPDPAAVSPADAIAMVRHALDLGIRLFDTAEGYGRGLAEQHLGRALREAGHPGDVVIVSKTGPLFAEEKIDNRPHNLSRAHLIARTEGCLRRLGIERIDVLLAHQPDTRTPVEETMAAAAELRQAGKIAHFGVSNFPATLLRTARGCGQVVCNQLPCSLADRSIEDGRRAACMELGIGIMAYSPIGKGVLSGKYDANRLPGDYREQRPHFRDHLDKNLRIAARLKEIAADFSTTPVTIALAWTLGLPGITCAIPGAKSPAQIDDHVAAARLLDNPELVAALATLDT